MSNIEIDATEVVLDATNQDKISIDIDGADGALSDFLSCLSSQHDDESYNIDSNPKGLVLIFNHKTFSNGRLKAREGTDEDAKGLYKLFRRFEYQVEKYDDVKKKEMVNIMEEAMLNRKKLSCFICVFLTHGNEGIIETYDDSVEADKLFELFTDCGWNGKPKVFISSVCRGVKFMKGVYDNVDGSWGGTVPSHGDFLFAHPTISGFFSFRNPDIGSYYIQTIINEFREKAERYDILSLLTHVNNTISQRSFIRNNEYDNKQVCEFHSRLRKKLYLI